MRTLELWHTDPIESIQSNSLMYFWGRIPEPFQGQSVLDYVEDHSDRLRSKYLAWLYDLSNFQLHGRPIAQHLQTQKDYNLWWMSSLAEKSYLNSPRIHDCIKLLALEEILKAEKPDQVIVYADDKELSFSVQQICSRLGICFLGKQIGAKKNKQRGWRRFIPFRPKFFSAVLWLLQYVKKHWQLRHIEKPDYFSGENGVSFFSYFVHLDQEKCSKGKFYSRLWEMLPETLYQHGLKMNWVHHFMLSPVVQNCRTALNWIDSFNKDHHRQGQHSFFDSYLNFQIIIHVCLNYFRLILKSFYFSKVSQAFQPKESVVSFWPLLKDEWLASTRGSVAMRNLMFIELVDAVCRNLPKQKLGLYLQENQYWERALICAWKRYNHGQLIGVAHSTIRYWDLRYFEDPRLFHDRKGYSQPQPDLVAVNGPVAKDLLKASGYLVDNIVEVEALRYLDVVIPNGKISETERKRNSQDKLKILILGDYQPDVTDSMLHAIEKFALNHPHVHFTLKAHPACFVNLNNYSIQNFSRTSSSLAEILSNFDIAIVAGASSAAIDVYLAGKQVVVYLLGSELNLSPLRGIPDVTFVMASDEIAGALKNQKKLKLKNQRQQFFWLENHLPRWKKLLTNCSYSQF